MRKFLSIENIIRGIIVIALIAFASTKYDLKNIILGLLVIFGMILLGVSLVRLYQECMSYSKNKAWVLSQTKTIIFVSSVVLTPIVFLLLLTPSLRIYSFLIIGVVLLVLLIYDLVKRMIK